MGEEGKREVNRMKRTKNAVPSLGYMLTLLEANHGRCVWREKGGDHVPSAGVLVVVDRGGMAWCGSPMGLRLRLRWRTLHVWLGVDRLGRARR